MIAFSFYPGVIGKQHNHVLHVVPGMLSLLTIVLLLMTVLMTESLLSFQCKRISTPGKLQQQKYISNYYSKRDPFMDNTTTEKDEEDDVGQFVFANKDDDNNDDENQIKTRIKTKKDDDLSTSTSSLSTGTVVISTIIFVSFWPLLAVLRTITSNSNPIDGFDIDMFIALKGIMDNTTPDSIAGGLNAAADYNPVIIELPPLSPAEQLVGAFFGPR